MSMQFYGTIIEFIFAMSPILKHQTLSGVNLKEAHIDFLTCSIFILDNLHISFFHLLFSIGRIEI